MPTLGYILWHGRQHKPEEAKMTQNALNLHVRRIHYLLQWFVAIALLQLAVLGWLTYKLVG